MLQSVRQLIVAEESGGSWLATWRKAPTQATTSGIFYDMSMAAGNPVPNYYASAPLASKALARSTDGGLDHGPHNGTKYLKTFTGLATAGVPITLILLDYVLYYPFVDMDNTSMTQVDPLPRYTDGEGLKIMAVMVAAQSGVGSPKFQISYTNSSGIPGRLTNLVSCNTATIPGNIITSHARAPTGYNHPASPFIPLQRGDTGVRSIESIIWQSPDVGLLSLVLVKPIDQTVIRDITAPVERSVFTDQNKMPAIAGDAYLNMIACPSGSISGAGFHGYLQTVWE